MRFFDSPIKPSNSLYLKLILIPIYHVVSSLFFIIGVKEVNSVLLLIEMFITKVLFSEKLLQGYAILHGNIFDVLLLYGSSCYRRATNLQSSLMVFVCLLGQLQLCCCDCFEGHFDWKSDGEEEVIELQFYCR